MNIALVGVMGSGKDTVARLLEPCGYKRLSLADPIRKILALVRAGELKDAEAFLKGLLTGYQHRAPEIIKVAAETTSQRQGLQTLGTEAVRTQDLIWLSHALSKIRPKERYVVTDCRRYVELREFLKLGFLCIYIDVTPDTQRRRLIQRDSMFNPKDLEHPAEQEIKNLRSLCHLHINNDGELEDLELTLRYLAEFSDHFQQKPKQREEAGE